MEDQTAVAPQAEHVEEDNLGQEGKTGQQNDGPELADADTIDQSAEIRVEGDSTTLTANQPVQPPPTEVHEVQEHQEVVGEGQHQAGHQLDKPTQEHSQGLKANESLPKNLGVTELTSDIYESDYRALNTAPPTNTQQTGEFQHIQQPPAVKQQVGEAEVVERQEHPTSQVPPFHPPQQQQQPVEEHPHTNQPEIPAQPQGLEGIPTHKEDDKDQQADLNKSIEGIPVGQAQSHSEKMKDSDGPKQSEAAPAVTATPQVQRSESLQKSQNLWNAPRNNISLRSDAGVDLLKPPQVPPETAVPDESQDLLENIRKEEQRLKQTHRLKAQQLQEIKSSGHQLQGLSQEDRKESNVEGPVAVPIEEPQQQPIKQQQIPRASHIAMKTSPVPRAPGKEQSSKDPQACKCSLM